MKTAIVPSVRVDPALSESVASLLEAGETLSGFVELAVRQIVLRCQNQAEFVARGLLSLETARRTGEYVDAGDVVDKLAKNLRRQSRSCRQQIVSFRVRLTPKAEDDLIRLYDFA